METIISNGTTINYYTSGTGKTTLLFVHGSFIDQTYWKEQVKYFEPDYKVVTLDLAGHGQSGREGDDWLAERFAGDIIAFIEELDLEDIILVGHSFAGDINLMVATQIPEKIKGFIAIDYFKNAATPLPAEMEKQKSGILENLKKDFAATNEQYVRMALVTKNTPEVITNRVVQAYRNAYEPMGQVNVAEVFEMYKTEQELLPRLKLKLYLINVNYQPTNTAPLEKYSGNGFDLTEIHGTSHFPMIEEPEKLNEALSDAIDNILKQ